MTILDTFGDFTPGLSSPICGVFDIVSDDVVDLPNVTRAIVLESGGDVSVVLKNGDGNHIASANRRGDLSGAGVACVGQRND